MTKSATAFARTAEVRDEKIQLDGLRLHYRDWGDADAPPLVLIHGSGLNARAYDALAGGVADRYRVLAPDMRGHGESDRAANYEWERAFGDLEAFVEALDLERPSMIGHSMGARLSMVYAAHHPDAVARLVLIDWVPDAKFTPEYRQALAQLFGTPRIEDPAAVVRAARTGQPRLREEAFRHVVESNLAPQPEGGWRWRLDPEVLRGREQAFPIPAETAAELLRQVRCPTLVIRAAESQYVTREQAERAAEQLPNGRVIEVPDCGHGLPWEQPERLRAAARTFLVGLERR